MKKVAVIDDNAIMLGRWEKKLEKESEVLLFPHALDFIEFAEKNCSIVENLDFIIVDRVNPGFDSIYDSFIQMLERCVKLTKPSLIMSSALNMRFQRGSDGFDIFTPKGPYSLKELEEKIHFFRDV